MGWSVLSGDKQRYRPPDPETSEEHVSGVRGAPVSQRCECHVEGRQEIDAVQFYQPLNAGAAGPEGCLRWQNHPQLLQQDGNLALRKSDREREGNDVGAVRAGSAADFEQGHLCAERNAIGAFERE